MTLKSTDNEYIITKFNDLCSSICAQCDKGFEDTKRSFYKRFKRNGPHYCSRKCVNASQNKKIRKPCGQCGKVVIRARREAKKSKSGHIFCSSSCAATYNNTHKTTGIRVSKLELWIKDQLSILYKDLNILYNDKKTISSELDVYIPSLNLAFELNGIFHYEPIYGQKKLSQIQNNDERKFQACLEKKIELCIIDSSGQKRFTEKSSWKYLDIIKSIINMKMVGVIGFEPT